MCAGVFGGVGNNTMSADVFGGDRCVVNYALIFTNGNPRIWQQMRTQLCGSRTTRNTAAIPSQNYTGMTHPGDSGIGVDQTRDGAYRKSHQAKLFGTQRPGAMAAVLPPLG